MHHLLKSILTVALFVGSVAACGSSNKSSAVVPGAGTTRTSSSAPSTAAPGSPTAGPTITISKELMFSSVPVKASATVTVKNESSVEHTVSADTTAGGFDITIEGGTTKTFPAPSKPGAYGFHCNIHTFMKNTLRVI